MVGENIDGGLSTLGLADLRNTDLLFGFAVTCWAMSFTAFA